MNKSRAKAASIARRTMLFGFIIPTILLVALAASESAQEAVAMVMMLSMGAIFIFIIPLACVILLAQAVFVYASLYLVFDSLIQEPEKKFRRVLTWTLLAASGLILSLIAILAA